MTEPIAATAAAGGAVEAALLALAAPGRQDLAPPRILPSGAIELIRVAAEDRAHTEELAARFGVDARRIEDAALHFVHAVMFHPDSDHFRVLGVRPDDDDETLKLHFRWLQKWLHPDRDPEGWSSVYAERINIAWAQLRRPDRREEYRERLRQSVPTSPNGAAVSVASPQIDRGFEFDRAGAPVISSRWARRLPAIVVGAVAVLAVGLFAAHRAGESLIAEERARAGADGRSTVARHSPVETTPDGIAVLPDDPTAVPSSVAAEDRERTPDDLRPASSSGPAGPIELARGAVGPDAGPIAGESPRAASVRIESERLAGAASAPAAEPASQISPGDTAPDDFAAAGQDATPGAIASTKEAVVPVPLVDQVTAARAPIPVPSPDAPTPIAAKAEEARRAASAPEAAATLVRVADARAEAPRLIVGARDQASAATVEAPTSMLEAGASESRSISAPEIVPVADPMVGRRLLNQFSAAYREGEVQRVVVLFAPNALTPAGNLLDLHQQYGSMFAASTRRSLEFLDVEWRPVPNGLEGVGRYEWAMRPRGKSTTEATSGRMRVVIEFIEGRPLIALLDQQDVG